MEFSFKKWRALKLRAKAAMSIPVVGVFCLCAVLMGINYTELVNSTYENKRFEGEFSLLNLKASLSLESSAMRKYFLGLVTVDELEIVKNKTDASLTDLSNKVFRPKREENLLDQKVSVPLASLRSQVLSGQIAWPEVEKSISDLSETLSSITMRNMKNKLSSVQYERLEKLNILQKTLVETSFFQNDLAYVVLRDMPLNSVQFSSLVRSLESANFYREKIKTGAYQQDKTFVFFKNQQEGLWGHILGHYDKVRSSVEQGRYGVQMPELLRSFNKFKLSINGGIEFYERKINKLEALNLQKVRRSFMWMSIFCVSFFLMTSWLTIMFSRRAMFYLASEMNGHDIKVISKNSGKKQWSNKIIPLSDYQKEEVQTKDVA